MNSVAIHIDNFSDLLGRLTLERNFLNLANRVGDRDYAYPTNFPSITTKKSSACDILTSIISNWLALRNQTMWQIRCEKYDFTHRKKSLSPEYLIKMKKWRGVILVTNIFYIITCQ
jgi:hypothetical protein